jgi:hypothetical protein
MNQAKAQTKQMSWLGMILTLSRHQLQRKARERSQGSRNSWDRGFGAVHVNKPNSPRHTLENRASRSRLSMIEFADGYRQGSRVWGAGDCSTLLQIIGLGIPREIGSGREAPMSGTYTEISIREWLTTALCSPTWCSVVVGFRI